MYGAIDRRVSSGIQVPVPAFSRPQVPQNLLIAHLKLFAEGLLFFLLFLPFLILPRNLA